MDTIFDERHRRLSKQLETAALDLLGYTYTAGVCIPIVGTTPPVYTVVGDYEQIKALAGFIETPGNSPQ